MEVLHGILTGCIKNPGSNKYSDVLRVLLLTLIYKTLHGQAAINTPPYVKHTTVMKTRKSDPMKFIPVQTSCDEYKYSFWPRTINDWNSLPPNIINMTSISNFKAAVNNYISA